jgi:beta-lactamase regulating signal transducer with metallopeptidase domain
MLEMFNDLAASWSSSILRATWQGGVTIAAAWILVRWMRGLRARLICWIWRLTDIKLIVAFLWATPVLLPLLPSRPGAEPRAGISASNPRAHTGPSVGSDPIALSTGGDDHAAGHAFHRPRAASLALVFWLCGVIGAASVAARGWLVATRLRRSCPPIDCPHTREVSAALAQILGLRKIPELRAGASVVRPMVVGAFRPTILLPVGMLRDQGTTAATQAILAHELAHIRRLDLIWRGWAALVRALFFFHPLVWLAQREALLASESACDALALGACGLRPAEYGRILLEIAATGPDLAARRAASLGMAGSSGSLKRRLIAMKTTQQPPKRQLLACSLALLAFGALGIVPWQLAPREAHAVESPRVRPAPESVRDVQDELLAARDKYVKGPLTLAESRLEVARAELRVAEDLVKQAEAEAAEAAVRVWFRGEEARRVAEWDKRGVAEPALIEEQKFLTLKARVADREAKLKIAVARASVEAARAGVREAEELRGIAVVGYDIARASLQRNDAAKRPPHRADAVPRELKEPRTRLRVARVARARFEIDAAAADVERAAASLEKARLTVEYQTKVIQRLGRLADRRLIEKKLVEDHEQLLTEAREMEHAAASAVGITRDRLKAGVARLTTIEASPRPN